MKYIYTWRWLASVEISVYANIDNWSTFWKMDKLLNACIYMSNFYFSWECLVTSHNFCIICIKCLMNHACIWIIILLVLSVFPDLQEGRWACTIWRKYWKNKGWYMSYSHTFLWFSFSVTFCFSKDSVSFIFQ